MIMNTDHTRALVWLLFPRRGMAYLLAVIHVHVSPIYSRNKTKQKNNFFITSEHQAQEYYLFLEGSWTWPMPTMSNCTPEHIVKLATPIQGFKWCLRWQGLLLWPLAIFLTRGVTFTPWSPRCQLTGDLRKQEWLGHPGRVGYHHGD